MNDSLALTVMINISKFKENVIIITNRGYKSYNTLAHIQKKGWNYVIRIKYIRSN